MRCQWYWNQTRDKIRLNKVHLDVLVANSLYEALWKGVAALERQDGSDQADILLSCSILWNYLHQWNKSFPTQKCVSVNAGSSACKPNRLDKRESETPQKPAAYAGEKVEGLLINLQSRKIWHSRIVAKLKTIWSTNSRCLLNKQERAL